MKTQQTHSISMMVTVALAWLGTSAPWTQAQGGDQNPGIVPIQADYGGQTYGEWLAKCYEWELGLPASGNPVLPGNQGNIAIGQPEDLGFLSELILAPVTELSYTVPAGKALWR